MASLSAYIARLDLEQHAYETIGRDQQFREWFRKFAINEKILTGIVTESPSTETIESTTNIIASTTPTTATTVPICYPVTHMKYKNNPLRIEDYPDCDKLDEDEKEFCRVARIQPVVYLRVKAVLIGENRKVGFCTYARARKIAGIDVNKTRLIHNLLLKLNLINAVQPKNEPV